MILVDKEIKEYVKNFNLIGKCYKEENVHSISYDLTIDKFIVDGKEIEKNFIHINPSDCVYVKTCEYLSMTDNLAGKIIEKNSLMRKYLKVDGPLYQPGHKTYCYLRVWNIGKKDIVLNTNDKIAQIVFIKLNNVPEITYDKQKDAHYNDEDVYRG